MLKIIINSLQTPPTPFTDPPQQPPSPRRTIAFTTPQNTYCTRLSNLLHHHNFTPISTPTIIVGPTPTTHSSLLHHISILHLYSAIAFTSRSGISAFISALSNSPPPLLPPTSPPLIVSALGKDAELLIEIESEKDNLHDLHATLSDNRDIVSERPLAKQSLTKLLSNQVKIILPSTPTPSGLVHSLGPGLGRKVLCPVPLVLGLEEPPVVPDFLKELGSMGWVPIRVNAYETKWAGPKCVEKLLEVENLDGLIFTSTAEVEGLLKSLREYGLDWEELRKKWPGLVVAAHGPVTAYGAERLGVRVDVVSSKFSSFEGVVETLKSELF